MSIQETNTEVSSSTIALYATQGGGLATYENNRAVWLEVPKYLANEGVKVGDEIPGEWGTAAVNEAAIQEMELEAQGKCL